MSKELRAIGSRAVLLFEPRDAWFGWFRDKDAHYITLVPCFPLKILRRPKR